MIATDLQPTTAVADLHDQITEERASAQPNAASLVDFRNSLDVLPALSMHNQADLPGGCVEHLCNVLLHDARRVQLAHTPHVGFRETSVGFALAARLSPLMCAVGHVVLMSAEE